MKDNTNVSVPLGIWLQRFWRPECVNEMSAMDTVSKLMLGHVELFYTHSWLVSTMLIIIRL